MWRFCMMKCRVVYNDYDDYLTRMENGARTNRILARLREVTAGLAKTSGKKIHSGAAYRKL